MNLRSTPHGNLLRCRLSLLLFLSSFGLVAAQSTSTPDAKNTITLSTRLVYVDVVVRDGSGHSVPGLTRQDFSVKEEGKPEAIAYFTDNTTASPATTSAVRENVPMQGGEQFSNVGTLGSNDHAANIILLDLLNTPVLDQLYSLKQLLQFLKTLPPGHQMALFLLTDRLHMLQGFTSSSDQLAAAANSLGPKDLHGVRSESDRMQMKDIVTTFAKALGHDPGGSVGHMLGDMDVEDAENLAKRGRSTAEAFAEIARAASGYPGRKNLLWLAEDFPVGVAAQLQLDRTPQGFDALGATNLIANLQIAIYPISLAGLQLEGVGADANGAGEVSLIGGPMGTALNPQAGDTVQSQFIARNSMYYAMNDLARATGGEAFHGSNDIAGALSRVVEDDAHYYTIAYRSTNTTWDGSYRSIAVNLAKKGYSLSYRRGYFATPTADGTRHVAEELQAALQPGMLDSSELRIQSTVSRSRRGSMVAIDVAVDPGDLTYRTDGTGHRQTQLLVSTLAFRGADQTKPIAENKVVLNVNLDPAQYAAILKSGLRFRQQLAIKPGQYQLRLGVAETGSHRIGTLDMPIKISDPGRSASDSAR